MEGKVSDKQSSYMYWVRDATEDAAPLPVPRKLSPEDLSLSLSLSSTTTTTTLTLGSVWNQAFLVTVRNKKRVGYTYELTLKSKGEWLIQEERKMIKGHLDIPEFSYGELEDLQAFLVTVRNKKRVGYTYELTLKFKEEWPIQEERKKIKGHLDIPEFSYGELEDLQIEVRFSEEKDIASEDKMRVSRDLRLFLAPIREKLLDFERELKDR